MKKIIVFLFALSLVACPRFMYAADKGLHLGGLERDAKKAKIEAKKVSEQTAREAEKAKKKVAREAEKQKREAEKAKKKAAREAQKKLDESKK
jgi:hypothetical protein